MKWFLRKLYYLLWLPEHCNTIKEPAKPRDPAPCGNDDVHYYWEDEMNWNCPKCFALAEREDKEREKEAQAERIATLVAKKLNR